MPRRAEIQPRTPDADAVHGAGLEARLGRGHAGQGPDRELIRAEAPRIPA